MAIPESPYSLRLWPGSPYRREYCLDFVYANHTTKSLKKPQGYELTVHVPMGSLPWLGIGEQPLRSIEENFAIAPEDTHEEEERFILRDGLVCVLTYAAQGHEAREVRFEVPVRPGGHAGF